MANNFPLASNKYILSIRTAVRLGEHDITTEKDCDDFPDCADPVVDIPIAETIVHEDYRADSASQEHDIALIRLESAVNYTDYVKPICLPIDETWRKMNLDGWPLSTVGWGISENGILPS